MRFLSTATLFAVVSAALPVSAAPAPRPIDRASATTGPDGAPITADDIKELQGMQDAIVRFESAQKDYRGTVSHIVKQEYEAKRNQLKARYDSQSKAAEGAERVRRDSAITLFERFLVKYPNDKRWTPDVIYRLAELYFEKTTDDLDTAAEAAQKAGQPPPVADFTKTIELYKRLINEFPQYRLVDGAYYLLGYCLDKMGKEAEARQAFLALVCINKYKPLDAPATTAATRGHGPSLALTDPYADCKPVREGSRFTPQSWVRVGEYHFDFNELDRAIAAYRRVLDFKDDPLFDKALYKLAWSYYRLDKYPEAIKRFDELVVFSDSRKAESGKEGSDLRAESVQYLGISFAEKDWNGDTIDDPESGLQRIEGFYRGREQEPHVREIYQKLGDIYFDETEYKRAIDVYRRILEKWPLASDNPKVQDRIVASYEKQRLFDEALKEREKFVPLFGRGSKWDKFNLDNPEARNSAAELMEISAAKVAVDHHRAAQSLRKLAGNDPAKIAQVKHEYEAAADGYRKYLEQYPNSKNSYEYGFNYAEALYYSGQFREAGQQYEKIRDSNLDNRFQEEAAFDAVKSYELLVGEEQKSGKLTFPPLPEVGKTQLPIKPTEIPADVKLLEGAYDAYARTVPQSPRIPTMAYKAAETEYRYLQWTDARARFEDILKKYCKDDVAAQAGRAILASYTIENDYQKIIDWTDKLQTAKCGGEVEQKKLGEEGKALVAGARFKIADDLMKNQEYEKAAQAYIDIVNRDPQNTGGTNDKALNNAAVCYEKLLRFGAATKVYERIVNEYPNSEFVDDALFRTALSYQKNFEYSLAVDSYRKLATDKRFASSPHHKDALYNAALLLEYQQAYDQAAALFQQYASEPKVDLGDRQEAYFRSGLIYLKNKDSGKATRTFREYLKTYGSDPKRILEANFHIAEAMELQRDHAGALAQYRKVAADGSRVPAASDAAEFAAHAAFLLVEQQLPELERMKLSPNPKQLADSKRLFERKVGELTAEYNKVLPYRRATWVLAAYYRIGYVYELYSKALSAMLTAPCPADVMALQRKQERAGETNPDNLACNIYQQQLTGRIEKDVASVDEEVVRRYRTVIEQAQKLGVSNEWTKLARQRLNAYKPDEFPMLKDEKVDFQLEAP